MYRYPKQMKAIVRTIGSSDDDTDKIKKIKGMEQV
jgi:hypothetical protein